MRAVRRQDTTPEIRVRKAAHGLGLRFRLHRRDLPGSPDLVFPKLKTVVFVHGCFWHRHFGCAKASTPKARAGFWAEKFDSNVRRDVRVARELRDSGWTVLVMWECETQSSTTIVRRLRKLKKN
jgi:DNA mismatch endonuclease (patch repair protein)